MPESPPPIDIDKLQFLTGELIIFTVAFVLLGLIFVWVVHRLAGTAPYAMIPLLVSIITITALIGFVLTGSEGLETLAAMGLGALAAALTHLFQPPTRHAYDKDEEVTDDAEHPDKHEEDVGD